MNNKDLTNEEIKNMLNRLKIIKENQVKASKAYYERNKEEIIRKNINKKLNRKNEDDPEALTKIQMKRREYYQSRKLKDPEYLKKQYIQKKEKCMNMPPVELSFEL